MIKIILSIINVRELSIHPLHKHENYFRYCVETSSQPKDVHWDANYLKLRMGRKNYL